MPDIFVKRMPEIFVDQCRGQNDWKGFRWINGGVDRVRRCGSRVEQPTIHFGLQQTQLRPELLIMYSTPSHSQKRLAWKIHFLISLSLQVTLSSLNLVLEIWEAMESLVIRGPRYDLGFIRITQSSALIMDCWDGWQVARVKIGKPVRNLQEYHSAMHNVVRAGLFHLRPRGENGTGIYPPGFLSGVLFTVPSFSLSLNLRTYFEKQTENTPTPLSLKQLILSALARIFSDLSLEPLFLYFQLL